METAGICGEEAVPAKLSADAGRASAGPAATPVFSGAPEASGVVAGASGTSELSGVTVGAGASPAVAAGASSAVAAASGTDAGATADPCNPQWVPTPAHASPSWRFRQEGVAGRGAGMNSSLLGVDPLLALITSVVA